MVQAFIVSQVLSPAIVLQSEIVIPIHDKDRIVGVLDVDSPILSFDGADRAGLESRWALEELVSGINLIYNFI